MNQPTASPSTDSAQITKAIQKRYITRNYNVYEGIVIDEMEAKTGHGRLTACFDRHAKGDVLTSVTATKHPSTQKIVPLFSQRSGIESLSLYKGTLESIQKMDGQKITDRAEMVAKLKKWVALENDA